MAQDLKLPDSIRALQDYDSKKAIWLIIGVSVAAVLFLFWLIYFKPPTVTQLSWIKNLSFQELSQYLQEEGLKHPIINTTNNESTKVSGINDYIKENNKDK